MKNAKIHINNLELKSVHIGQNPVRWIGFNNMIKVFYLKKPLLILQNNNTELLCLTGDRVTESFDVYIDDNFIGNYKIEEEEE